MTSLREHLSSIPIWDDVLDECDHAHFLDDRKISQILKTIKDSLPEKYDNDIDVTKAGLASRADWGQFGFNRCLDLVTKILEEK